MSAQIPYGRAVQPSEEKSGNGAERAPRYARSTVVVGKYRLEEVARREPYGDVWVGTQRKLGLPVAIKIFHPNGPLEWFESELAAAAFEDRIVHVANTLAKLVHPSIERVLECAVTEVGDPFIATERLHGEDLRALLARERRLVPGDALAMMLPIFDGLDAAHERGLVHGDLRPESIFLAHVEERLEPKILDLGLTLAADEFGGRTAPYASPEVLRGRRADSLSDVYSLSMILYEMLGGSVPIATSVDESAIRKLPLTDEAGKVRPDLLQGVDHDLAAILERGLTRSRHDRWPSISDMGEALAVWLVGKGIEEDCEGVSLYAKWLRHGDTLLQPMPLERAPSAPPAQPIASAAAAPIAFPPVEGVVAPAPRPYPVRGRGFEEDLRALPVEIPKRSWPNWLTFLGVLAIIGVGVGLFVSVLLRTPPGVRAVAAVARENLDHQIVGVDVNAKVEAPTLAPAAAPAPAPAPAPTTTPVVEPKKAAAPPADAPKVQPPKNVAPQKPAPRPAPPPRFPPRPPATPSPAPPALAPVVQPPPPEDENPL